MGPKTNRKAQEARDRKATAKKEAATKSLKAAEDAKWQNTDERQLRKEKEQKEAELKRQEAIDKRRTNKLDYDAELLQISDNKKKQMKEVKKITQADINRNVALEAALRAQIAKEADHVKGGGIIRQQLFEDNVNREQRTLRDEALAAGMTLMEATNIDAALAAMAKEEDSGTDRFATKRRKAAFNEFCETMIPVYKQEKPGLRQQQYKQLAFKAFQKSPFNPVNQNS